MLFYCMERLIFQGLQRIIYLRSLSQNPFLASGEEFHLLKLVQ